MKQLLHHARQLHQRRMSAFYLLPEKTGGSGSTGQLDLEHIPQFEDRPRTLREMFVDIEYENEEDR